MKLTEGPKKPLCNFERIPSNFLEIHPVELGRQLALMEFKMFKRITPLELLRQVLRPFPSFFSRFFEFLLTFSDKGVELCGHPTFMP
jgi:hypothetical protein